MATTKILDLIVPEMLAAHTQEAALKLNKLIASGIVGVSPVLGARLQGPSAVFEFPFFQHTDNQGVAANVPNDNPAQRANTQKLTTGKQAAVRVARNRAIEAASLAAQLAGQDLMAVAASQMAQLHNTDRQLGLMATLAGVINETVAPGLVLSIASESVAGASAATKFSAGALIDVTTDAWSDANGIAAIVVHPKVYAQMQKDNLVSNAPVAAQNIGFGTYLGMYTIVVDAQVPVRAGTTDGQVYTTYVVRNGGIQFAAGVEDVPVALVRDEMAALGGGVETLISRDRFAYHIIGSAYKGNALAIPEDTDLASAANWELVFDKKSVGVCAIVHNI